MAYIVNFAALAQRDIVHLYNEMNAERSDASRKWYRGLKEAILNLEERPNRCPATRKNSSLKNLLYGHKPHVYRVIYHVVAKRKQLDVLHIRHGARRKFRASDIA